MDDYDVSPWTVGTQHTERKLNYYNKVRVANGLQPMTDHERDVVGEWLIQSLKEKSYIDILDRGEAFLSIDEDKKIRLKKVRTIPHKTSFQTFNEAIALPIEFLLTVWLGTAVVGPASDSLGPFWSIVYYLGSVAGIFSIYFMLSTSQIGYIREIRQLWRKLWKMDKR